MIGPVVNATATLIGGLIGGFLGDRLPAKYRTNLPLTFGVASMAMGVVMIGKMETLPAVVMALIIGAIFGEMFNLEQNISRGALKCRRLIDKVVPQKSEAQVSQSEFLDMFVGILVLFVASGTGVFGSMSEGITGDPSILIAKAFLDLCTAAIFATTLGVSVALIAIPQLALQGMLYLLGQQVMALTTPVMIADFSALGGIIMLATGFRIAGIRSFPIANLLPGLLIVMPLSALWCSVIVPWIDSVC
ncbi:DUF554 domain-containing protein [Rhodobacteraceae bacterium RKSG542]|uniref:DUF554 domain-containing protein n=1 Tax=Pseudovibrio flavus TaxID=2529854 RepID=UPI0012BB8BFA|nr:DUF554 domain-containing protein [Pseudovibrio flavus]MTI15978.1 DUF554 domain-containing protein [Pseudovibrio flavus]